MNFIVLSTQRSGTNLLRKSINSHPDLHCHNELGMNREMAAHAIRNKVDGLKSIRVRKDARLVVCFSPGFPLNLLHSLPDGSGYVVQYNQLDVGWGVEKRTPFPGDAPRSDVDLSPFNVIHLVRTNVFERALSCYINDQLLDRGSPRRGSLNRNKNIDYGQTFHIEPAPLQALIKKSKKDIEYWRTKINEDDPNCLTLDYEELFDEQSLTRGWEAGEPDVLMPRPASEKICDFLQVSRHELRSPIKRTNTPDYENYIENWDEVKVLREIVEL